jgi:hypothetical protein
MIILALVAGIALLLVVLWDTFETVVLPRSVTREFRLTKFFYRALWTAWRGIARSAGKIRFRDTLVSYFGPLSLILLLALWAVCLMLGFALIQWGMQVPLSHSGRSASFGEYVYLSGVTLFTLGYGDLTAGDSAGRVVSVLEAGVGIGFLAMVIGYLPVIYQAFSRREVGISLLDARAGSPPTAGELLRRHAEAGRMEELADLLKEWERWAADILESHLSYPVLTFYRSQHDRESWLAALTAIIDTCALLRFCGHDDAEWRHKVRWQAQLTFAMARHTLVDLALILNKPPQEDCPDRLGPVEWESLVAALDGANVGLAADAHEPLARMRRQYDPYVIALADYLLLELPPWSAPEAHADNWETSAWENQHHF